MWNLGISLSRLATAHYHTFVELMCLSPNNYYHFPDIVSLRHGALYIRKACTYNSHDALDSMKGIKRKSSVSNLLFSVLEHMYIHVSGT